MTVLIANGIGGRKIMNLIVNRQIIGRVIRLKFLPWSQSKYKIPTIAVTLNLLALSLFSLNFRYKLRYKRV